MYVFEVQTKGSIDSLFVNLQKTLKNAAVQGIIAVSNQQEIERMQKHVKGLPGLEERLKFWDYSDVIKTYEALQTAHEIISALELVPNPFQKT
jgi:hypothetical protein